MAAAGCGKPWRAVASLSEHSAMQPNAAGQRCEGKVPVMLPADAPAVPRWIRAARRSHLSPERRRLQHGAPPEICCSIAAVCRIS